MNDWIAAFQPIKDISALTTERGSRYEMLLRIKEDGILKSPYNRLKRFSQSDWIDLDCWNLQQLNCLSIENHYHVNISAFALDSGVFWTHLARCRHWITIEMLEVQITNTTALHQLCRDFSVVIDDLGAGYSGLNRLCEFDFEGFKVDGRLVAGAGSNRRADTILGCAMKMAQDLHKSCVLEHVENLNLWAHLRSLHESYAPELAVQVQGWAVGMPETWMETPCLLREVA